jgi:hypothetical protein
VADDVTKTLSLSDIDELKEDEMSARSNRTGIWATMDPGATGTNSNPFTLTSARQYPHGVEPTDLSTTIAASSTGTVPTDSNTIAAPANGDTKDLIDCKPEANTVALKRPDPPPPPTETKPQVKTSDNSRVFTLGPRGGCFYITAGGSKKYVDRGLCSSPAAVAARQ